MVPYIQHFWRELPEQRKLVDLYKNIPSFTEVDQEQSPYVQYVQKHAILDVMFNSYIADHFMGYDYFPFNGMGLQGWQQSIHNTKEFWTHFYSKYSGELSKVYISAEEGDKFLNRMKYQERTENDQPDDMIGSTSVY